jgi:glycosyltransferase involved in cell wall biosynthesis
MIPVTAMRLIMFGSFDATVHPRVAVLAEGLSRRGHDVCLGIFGNTPKARRVVPDKMFQGAAAGCVVLTSSTAPQRAALGHAALFVPPGDASALANALRRLARDSESVDAMAATARRHAREHFSSPVVVAPLVKRLEAMALRRAAS